MDQKKIKFKQSILKPKILYGKGIKNNNNKNPENQIKVEKCQIAKTKNAM